MPPPPPLPPPIPPSIPSMPCTPLRGRLLGCRSQDGLNALQAAQPHVLQHPPDTLIIQSHGSQLRLHRGDLAPHVEIRLGDPGRLLRAPELLGPLEDLPGEARRQFGSRTGGGILGLHARRRTAASQPARCPGLPACRSARPRAGPRFSREEDAMPRAPAELLYCGANSPNNCRAVFSRASLSRWNSGRAIGSR